MPRLFQSLMLSVFLAGALLAHQPKAYAQEGGSLPEILLEEGLDKIISAMELMFMAIPQYEMPEVMENGDIIIRRKQPIEKAPEEDEDSDPNGQYQT